MWHRPRDVMAASSGGDGGFFLNCGLIHSRSSMIGRVAIGSRRTLFSGVNFRLPSTNRPIAFSLTRVRVSSVRSTTPVSGLNVATRSPRECNRAFPRAERRATRRAVMLPGAGARPHRSPTSQSRRVQKACQKAPDDESESPRSRICAPAPGSRVVSPRRTRRLTLEPPHRHRQRSPPRASGDGRGIRRAPRRPESSRQNKRCQSSDPRGGFRVPPRVDVIARARRRDPPGRLQAKVISHQPRRRQPRARPARRRAGRAVLVGRHPNHPSATRDLPSWLPQPEPAHGAGGPGTFVPPPAFEPVTIPPVIDVDRIRISEGYAQFLGPTPAGDVINPRG